MVPVGGRWGGEKGRSQGERAAHRHSAAGGDGSEGAGGAGLFRAGSPREQAKERPHPTRAQSPDGEGALEQTAGSGRKAGPALAPVGHTHKAPACGRG